MPSDITVSITDGSNPATKVVALTGELDESNLESVKTQIDPILNDANVKAIVLDLANLGFINSKGIGFIVSVHTHLSKDQRTLAMAAAKEAVMDVISLVGLTSIIPYSETLDEALSKLT